MPDLNHQPQPASSEVHSLTRAKMRLGIWMFLIYGVVYAGFVIINLTRPRLMESIVLLGLNLAAVYGFGLIVFALLLALVYNHLCGGCEERSATTEGR